MLVTLLVAFDYLRSDQIRSDRGSIVRERERMWYRVRRKRGSLASRSRRSAGLASKGVGREHKHLKLLQMPCIRVATISRWHRRERKKYEMVK